MVRPNWPARSRSILISSVGKFISCANCRSRKKASFANCGLDLLRVGVIVLQAGALHGDFDGRGRSEAHHLGDDVAGFEGDLGARQFARAELSRSFSRRASPRGASGLSATWMMASCGPLVNR